MSSNQEHARYRDLLERHLDGDLAPAERMNLFDHLEFCEECRGFLEAEERLLARLRSVPKLVAPSNLRANIVHKAVREHHERRTPLIDDPRFAAMLNAAAAEKQVEGDSKFKIQNSKLADTDLPVFAGVSQPRRSRIRATWRRASPYMAYTFVGVAGLGALYTGNFRSYPIAREAQSALRTAIALAAGQVAEPEEANSAIGRQIVQADAIAPSTTRPSATTTYAPNADAARAAEYASSVTRGATDGFARARSALTALARAADGTYPDPAELSGAKLATIVLRPTDTAARLSFEQDALGQLLAELEKNQSTGVQQTNVVTSSANTGSGEALSIGNSPADQFAYEGHRYRTYRVRLVPDRLNTAVQALEKYRVPADDGVLRALSVQNRIPFTTARGQVAFFASPTGELKTALQSAREVGSAVQNEATSSRHIQIVVVE